MMRELEGRPGDRRGFIHKTILGVIGKVSSVVPLPGAQIISRVATTLAGGGGPPPPPRSSPFGRAAKRAIPAAFTSRPSAAGAQVKEQARVLKFGAAPGVGCNPPNVIDPRTGLCQRPVGGIRGAVERFLPGGATGFEAVGVAPVGDAVMGRFGAALQPGIMQIDRAVCLRGMVLAIDGLCYNKSQVSNKQRMWPRGRRPLITGGEMRAVAIASSAGKRLDKTTKRLRDLGLMKQLPKPRKAPAAHAHAVPAAAVSV